RGVARRRYSRGASRLRREAMRGEPCNHRGTPHTVLVFRRSRLARIGKVDPLECGHQHGQLGSAEATSPYEIACEIQSARCSCRFESYYPHVVLMPCLAAWGPPATSPRRRAVHHDRLRLFGFTPLVRWAFLIGPRGCGVTGTAFGCGTP